MPRRIALILRGHIRDGFSNDHLSQFLIRISNDPRLCVHLYMQTWEHDEASHNGSWRELGDAVRVPVTSESLRAYIPIPAHGTRILTECRTNLVGDVDGKIGGTSKLGWKWMWLGMFTIMNDIRNGGFAYDSVVSMRFDFFGAYVSGRHISDYGRVISAHDIIEWVVASNSQKISFLSEDACTGVDNCYIGPPDKLFTLCACFHFNLDHTCTEVGSEFNQEKMVFKMSMHV
jgi:hypothetical protein